MRVLFFVRHAGYIRNFESALQELAARGHAVHVAFDSSRVYWHEGVDPLARLRESGSALTFGSSPPGARDGRALFARGLRLSLDYLRYLEPRYRDARKLRERAGQRIPAPIRCFPGLRLRFVRRALASVLRLAERTLPGIGAVDDFIREHRPDVVLVSPLVASGSPQVEYLRSARRLGIPSVYCVASWDNLTNKGVVHELPDVVLVWNEAQRQEAVELHGVPLERVVVTGAQCYDHWFDREPSTTREEFCRHVGLRSDRTIVLYLCSSGFVAPEEVPFVRRWLKALRSAEPPLSEAGVLVRPHPQNSSQWADVDLEDDQTAIWPRGGADPVDETRRAGYFDSMFHAALVVGVNTSAQIESAIVGRPVHTVLAPEFRDTQIGTLHFEHIAGEHGMVHVARSLDEHVAQLGASLAHGPDERSRAFVEGFVRPRGLEISATPIFVDAIERAAGWTPAEHRPAESVTRPEVISA